MASGTACSVGFTPPVAGVVKVSVTFSAASSRSDWGGGTTAKLFLVQGGVTTFDASIPVNGSRAPYALIGSFPVNAGSAVTCGLYGAVSGASAMTFYDMSLLAELTSVP